MYIVNLVRSEFIKMKHTSFYAIHICIPLIGSLIFLLYFRTSKINSAMKVQSYLEVLSIVFPLLISIITSQAMKEERDAGSYKEILSSQYGRISCIIGKMSMLFICGFSSLIIAISTFVFSMKYILNQNYISLGLEFYIKSTLIIFGCQIIMYIFHLWLNLRFNSGISMLIGTFESMLSALMMTGLGDNIWQWLPSGLNIRLNQYFILKNVSLSLFYKINDNISLGIRNSIIFTIISVIIFMCWFKKYDARIEN
ncbi:MAG: lantibiotic immunity ABC transporter MutG family permease subunit [Clostridium sp.]|nr:lantibiotic immunity ABC transporter MutG family permease subunit [Clostridium sp.]